MDNQFYVRDRGAVRGPYNLEKLRSLAHRGQLSRAHELSQDRTHWVCASAYPEVFLSDDSSKTVEPTPVQSGDPGRELMPTFAVPPRQGRTRSSGTRSYLWPIVISGVVGAVSFVAVLAVFLIRNKAGQTLQEAVTITVGSHVPLPLSSIKEHKAIADAVGKVVVGGEYTNYEGEHFEIPFSSGSAFAISQNGFMLTNKHVVEDYLNLSRADQKKAELLLSHKLKLREMLWVFINGEKYVAKLVYNSPKHDYAILKVERRFARPFGLKLSSSDLLDAEVRAIGFPGVAATGFSEQEIIQQLAKKKLRHADVVEEFNERDLKYLLTSGRVSQVTNDEAVRATWLQHTANIAPGNSGGPLVLPNATVVGINTQVVGDKKELGAQFFRAMSLGQFRKEIDQQADGVIWVP